MIRRVITEIPQYTNWIYQYVNQNGLADLDAVFPKEPVIGS
jgi:hypothetical protein